MPPTLTPEEIAQIAGYLHSATFSIVHRDAYGISTFCLMHPNQDFSYWVRHEVFRWVCFSVISKATSEGQVLMFNSAGRRLFPDKYAEVPA